MVAENRASEGATHALLGLAGLVAGLIVAFEGIRRGAGADPTTDAGPTANAGPPGHENS